MMTDTMATANDNTKHHRLFFIQADLITLFCLLALLASVVIVAPFYILMNEWRYPLVLTVTVLSGMLLLDMFLLALFKFFWIRKLGREGYTEQVTQEKKGFLFWMIRRLFYLKN